MEFAVRLFEEIEKRGFDVQYTYHADAILQHDFPDAGRELEQVVSTITIPIDELIRGGGGEAQLTQRLRRLLESKQWRKRKFEVEKRIDERTTFSQTHEVDHSKDFDLGTLALEIEWNNKDPFYDRDLETFNRLHADGAISVGIILTRGSTFQANIQELIREFAEAGGISSYSALENYGIQPTARQRDTVETAMRRGAEFPEAWSKAFTSDKFGAATTHWAKLADRLARGVGSPCPVVALGIPISCVEN